jgi:hypothetical protein
MREQASLLKWFIKIVSNGNDSKGWARPDAPLPDAVVSRKRPLIIAGSDLPDNICVTG